MNKIILKFINILLLFFAQNIIAQNELEIHYKFDDDITEEIKGDNLTVVGETPSYITGKDGHAIQFNGNQRVEILGTTNFTYAAFTATYWVRMPDVTEPNGWRAIMEAGRGTNSHWQIFKYHSSNTFGIKLGGNMITLDTTVGFNDGTWYHLAQVWDGVDTLKFYVDGVLVFTDVETSPSYTPSVNVDVVFGAKQNGGEEFSGAIDDFKLYSKEMNATEVQNLYNSYNTTSDTENPFAPTLSSTAQTDTTVDLSWTAATDNVTGYNIYKDGVLEITTGNVLSYQVIGLTANTQYDFAVTALDGANNESAMSNTLDVTTDSSHSGANTSLWSLNNQDIYYNMGNVGIGTSIPDSELTVKGTIHSEEVKVDLSVPAPDYVFKENYSLTSLEELQEYIKKYGHLPNIPSAVEMEANGVELGIMNMKLLEKIEELTLYMLQQQKELSSQKNNYKTLEKQLIELQKLINTLKK